MFARLFGATLAIALLTYPVEAGKSQRELFTPQTEKQRKFTCAVGLLFIPHPACFYKVGGKAGKAQVTIHKPESGTCANGNTYRVIRVANPRSVCRNSIKGGSAAAACVNLSTIRGKTHGVIIIPKSGAHLAHEIEHVCRGPEWNH